jgi:hypothetical protein
MDDAQRQAARLLLDSLSAYDSDASDEMNEKAIGTAIDELGELTVDSVIAAATLLLIPLVDSLTERDRTDRHSVLAMLRQHVDPKRSPLHLRILLTRQCCQAAKACPRRSRQQQLQRLRPIERLSTEELVETGALRATGTQKKPALQPQRRSRLP